MLPDRVVPSRVCILLHLMLLKLHKLPLQKPVACSLISAPFFELMQVANRHPFCVKQQRKIHWKRPRVYRRYKIGSTPADLRHNVYPAIVALLLFWPPRQAAQLCPQLLLGILVARHFLGVPFPGQGVVCCLSLHDFWRPHAALAGGKGSHFKKVASHGR